MMNFNFSQKPEYNLNASLTHEIINNYGIHVKFLIVERVNLDANIFGDFSHLKTNKDNIFDFFALPEVSESFDISNFNFNDYGFNTFENISLFVFAKTLDDIIDMKNVIGNLIVLPNNKVMEISNIEFMVPGVNNLFTYNDMKSVYRLTCVPYEFKSHDEIDDSNLINTITLKDNDETIIGYEDSALYKTQRKVSVPSKDDVELELINRENYKALDDYIESLIKEKDNQDYEAEVLPYAETIIDNDNEVDEIENKAIYSQDEKDIWNGY